MRLLVSWLLVSCCAAAAGEDAAALVRALGSREAARRDAARAALRALGPKALAALVAGLDSPSPEVSRVCAELISQWAPEAAPLLRGKGTGPRSRELLDELERADCARVTLVAVARRGGEIGAAELFLRAGEEGTLGRHGGTVPRGQAAALADAASQEEEAVAVILLRLRGAEGLHVLPETPFPEVVGLGGTRDGVVVFALIRRCARTEETERQDAREALESALAAAVIRGRNHDGAAAYLDATGSARFLDLLRARWRAGHVRETTALLIRHGPGALVLARELAEGYEGHFVAALPGTLPPPIWARMHAAAGPALRSALEERGRLCDPGAPAPLFPNPLIGLRRVCGASAAEFHRRLRSWVAASICDLETAFATVCEDLRQPLWCVPAMATLSSLRDAVDEDRRATLASLLEGGRCALPGRAALREFLHGLP
ncbi:MAG: hypothetical protein ACT4PV_02480 [Planctomycetaceae bacterium]